MTQNHNHPLNLSITPSTHPSLKLADAFSHSAQRDAINKYGIAGRVWEAAYAMSIYVNSPANQEFDPPFPDSPSPRTMIELGSGTGAVAAAIANVLDEREDLVIATDLPEVCPLLEGNLCASPGCPILIRPLVWGDTDDSQRLAAEIFFGPNARAPTHIICSDLVYFPELLAPLLRCLIQLTSPGLIQRSPQPMVIISYKLRSLTKEIPFWSAFGLWFSFQPILVKHSSDPTLTSSEGETGGAEWRRFGADVDDDIFVFIARRRPESLNWQVPSDDQALLGGVNAWGNPDQKSDDTFESLLLMSFGYSD
ncbi:hypothetical protein P691DRAFT_771476 [Macrolepiota fuliginosa MF-IS2]|uniref:Methyltransferase-domain-containing protein n=1 Tax=Macrolepiota fuliginosa MF-IS2 TaxID=1400762 RepID=A0A9P5XN83_9AGAR|nr:hypothetical protein P691DRAFT_771476 [Macrolepiota fuliginosa MF-IS2]